MDSNEDSCLHLNPSLASGDFFLFLSPTCQLLVAMVALCQKSECVCVCLFLCMCVCFMMLTDEAVGVMCLLIHRDVSPTPTCEQTSVMHIKNKCKIMSLNLGPI